MSARFSGNFGFPWEILLLNLMTKLLSAKMNVSKLVWQDSVSLHVKSKVLLSVQVALPAMEVVTSILPDTGNGVPLFSFFCSIHLLIPQVICCLLLLSTTVNTQPSLLKFS